MTTCTCHSRVGGNPDELKNGFPIEDFGNDGRKENLLHS